MTSAIKRKKLRRNVFIWVLLFPSLVIFLLYRIFPLAWNGLLSIQFWSMYKPATFAGLYHYKELLFYDDVFRQSLLNTFLFMLGSPIGIALGMVIALLVNRPIRGRNIYRTIMFMSFPVMTVATGVIWLWLYSEKTGLINYFLMSVGLIDQGLPFLEDVNLALPAIIFVSIWQVVGLYMIIILTGLQNIPPSLYEAATLDRASPWQQFWMITFPLLRPSIFLCMIVGIINSFTAFDLIYVMTNGGPGHATELLITYIYKVAFTLARFDYAAAITVVNFLVFISLTWLVNRLSGGDAGAADTN